MSDEKRPPSSKRPSFNIRRVPAPARSGSAEIIAPPPPSEPPESIEPEIVEDDNEVNEQIIEVPSIAPDSLPVPEPVTRRVMRTGAFFLRAADALSFLGAVSAAGLAAQAWSLRGPGGCFWVEVPASPRRAASMAFLAGGRPFAGEGSRWSAVLSDGGAIPAEASPPDAGGDLLLVTGSRVESLSSTEWHDADLRGLLGQSALRRISLRSREEIAAAVPSVLSRWVLARAVARGLQVSLCPAERRPLAGDWPVEGVVWMRMRAEGTGVPPAWIAALADLPGVQVTYPVGTEAARLFIDARCEAPLSGPLLESLLPGDEAWLLGAEDAGHARIRPMGEMVDGASLIQPPAPAAAPLVVPGDARMPEPVPVRLVRRNLARPGDAVLLDEKELGWLRTYLMTRPLGESMFVVGGGDRFLVLAAGELAAKVPFGIEVCRVGPGGLYLEQGLDFFPPLPEEARLKAFNIQEHEVVVLTEGGCYRLDAGGMVPAWSLWAGAPPPISTQVPGETMRRLQEITKAIQGAPPEPAKARAATQPTVKTDLGERARLRAQAAEAELRGDLPGAARLLERAGDFRAAGRLYERAAGGMR